jgi:hypothetical protein
MPFNTITVSGPVVSGQNNDTGKEQAMPKRSAQARWEGKFKGGSGVTK